jgi:hypothetical protein
VAEQLEIDVPNRPADGRAVCAWCGAPATSTFEVEPPIWGTSKKMAAGKLTSVKVMKRRPILARTCDPCFKRLVHQPDPSA